MWKIKQAADVKLSWKAFAGAMRGLARRPHIDRGVPLVDIVGTGGDRLGTINISSTAALLCAAAGVTVAKHGNRAVTSQSGSADVLETLGVKIDLSPEAAARSLREHGFAFFFAPLYHPRFSADRAGAPTVRRAGSADDFQSARAPAESRAPVGHAAGCAAPRTL